MTEQALVAIEVEWAWRIAEYRERGVPCEPLVGRVPGLVAEVRRLRAVVEAFHAIGGEALAHKVAVTLPLVHEHWPKVLV